MVDKPNFTRLENALIDAGRSIEYPVTPDLASRVRLQLQADPSRRLVRPRLRWRPAFSVVMAIVLALALLLAIPETRAVIAQWLGLRSIHIIEVTPTPTIARATPPPTPTPGVVPFNQCCPSSLPEAQRRATFKILLPPDETPSQVFFQDQIFGQGSDAQQVVLVFGDPQKPRFVLYEARSWVYEKVVGIFAKQVGSGTLLTETQVNGQRALWFTGAPHILVTLDGSGNPILDTERPVNANTLAWEVGTIDTGVTYRLETALGLEEAIKFAEALK
jgi:hypothetical protein